jgi:2-haloacid dehalogenase
MLGDIHGMQITDVATGLGQLRDKGYRLVTLTNSSPSRAGETPLQRAGLGHFV